MSSTIIVPPIRAPLSGPGVVAGRRGIAAPSAAQTATRDWYLFFDQLVRRMRRLDASVNQGSHAERLDINPGNVPDGALWVETDRGNVVYQVQTDEDGTPQWVYLAGTMPGTISPDERPTDLGELDAGFQFATTDTEQIYQWDGDAWVDITPASGVGYGTHAARLALAPAGIADGALWVETDRGNVLYQFQSSAWWYVAGVMDGTTSSPDERPTDLGANDIDFSFRDTVNGAIWTWTGTVWQDPGTALFLQETGYAMVLQNGWTNFGGGFQSASYLRDRNGWVHLRGLIGGGTTTAPVTLATLLSGYRPLVREMFIARYAGGFTRIDVDPSGDVISSDTLSTNFFLSLSGISFSMQG